MTITATELKNNLGKYLILAATEDIFITKNGKTIAKLTSPYQNKLDTVDALFGSIPDTITFEEARKEQFWNLLKNDDVNDIYKFSAQYILNNETGTAIRQSLFHFQ